MWTVDFHVEAEDEMGEAVDWYAARNPRAALAFEAKIRTAIASIASDPSRMPALGPDRYFYLLKRFPYLVVHRSLDDAVEVLAVAYTSRRPGSWNTRT